MKIKINTKKKLVCPFCEKEIDHVKELDGFFVICPHCGRHF